MSDLIHKTVALLQDLPEHGLRTGDIGAVVDESPDRKWCQVEFVTVGGDTIALESLPVSILRLVSGDEIFAARPLSKAA